LVFPSVGLQDITPNTSAVVCDAVLEYRARQLKKELEAAHNEDAAATAELASEWEATDHDLTM
jgi:hypothetical protein